MARFKYIRVSERSQTVDRANLALHASPFPMHFGMDRTSAEYVDFCILQVDKWRTGSPLRVGSWT